MLKSLNIEKKFSIFTLIFVKILLENEQIRTNGQHLDPDPGDEKIRDPLGSGSGTLKYVRK